MVVPGAMLGFAGDMDRDTRVAGCGDSVRTPHPKVHIQKMNSREIVFNIALPALSYSESLSVDSLF